MSRYKKYRSDKALREAVTAYFDSISRIRTVMEVYNTGEKDKWGHFIQEQRPVTNARGEAMTEREYVIPPTVGGLCGYLGISRDTWAAYCSREANPQFAETTAWAREILRGYLEGQLLTRSGKDLKGVIFSLQNNYGMSEKKTVELGPKAAEVVVKAGAAEREALLRKIAEEFGGDGSDDGGPGEAGTDGPAGVGEADDGGAADGAGYPAVVEGAQADQ